MSKLTRAFFVAAVFAALFLVPSVASASPELTHPTGTTAPVGTLIEMKNVAHSISPKGFATKGATGTFECATTTMTGELAKNSGTQIQANITTAEFRGTPEEPNSADCFQPGGYGATTMTPNHTQNPTHNGNSSLPWCFTVEGAEDKFSLRGGKCSEAARPLVFVYHSAVAGACTFQKSALSGTYTTHPSDAIFTVQGQEFTRATGSAFCPGAWGMDWSFTMTTDGNNTPIYIS
jgi:hypothetical protein